MEFFKGATSWINQLTKSACGIGKALYLNARQDLSGRQQNNGWKKTVYASQLIIYGNAEYEMKFMSI